MQIEIIANPVAGGGRAKEAVKTVEGILDRGERRYEIHWTDSPGDATELAGRLESGSEALVAVGGDGTVMEVLNGVSSPDTPVGIIPAGMGNDLARCLSIPEEISQATRNLVTGATRRIDLGSAKGQLFNFMGVGFPSEVVRNVERHKNGWTRGSSAYMLGLLRSITELTAHEVELRFDGREEVRRASAVLVASCGYTGGGLNLIPHADPSDGLLDVALIREVGRIELILALRGVYDGNHVNHPKIEFFRGRSVEIRSGSGEELGEMFDGDPGGTTPTELNAAPGARSIIVPAGKDGEPREEDPGT